MLRVDGNEIHASGEVGYAEDGFTREQMVSALQNLQGDITLHLQSEGGNVFEGQSIYNQIKSYPGRVTCIIDSLSASIATIIQCAADRVIAHQNSSIMVHNPYTIAIGDAAQFRHTAEVLDKLTEDSAQIYAERTGKPTSYWRQVMAGEKWYSAKQAKEEGLVDEIIGAAADDPPRQPVAAVSSVVASPRLQAEQAKAVYRRKLIDHLTQSR